jgi:hypothetical protein
MPDWWNPFRSREAIAALWSSPLSPIASGPANGSGALLSTVRRLLVGRELTVRFARRVVTLTVTSFDARPGARALSLGQFGDVTAEASDVSIDGYQLASVNVVLRNAHVQPGASTRLVASPVNLEAALPYEMVDALLRNVAGWFRAEVGRDGVGRLRWARFDRLGWLEVDTAISGTTLNLLPRHLVVLGRRWALPRWVPRLPVAMPTPGGMSVTGIELQSDSVMISATLPEWTLEIPRSWGDDVVIRYGGLGIGSRPGRLQEIVRGAYKSM